MIGAAELAVLERIQRKVLWLSTWMVHHVNVVRPNAGGTKVGGHQASSSSIVSLLTAFYFKALGPDDLVAVKAHAAPASYVIQYLRGRLPKTALAELRSFGGLQAYPSRRKNRGIVDLSTGSAARHALAGRDAQPSTAKGTLPTKLSSASSRAVGRPSPSP